ncbi:MAG: ComEC/Rec2 family competence protein [Beijerinckiaceae bacterium]
MVQRPRQAKAGTRAVPIDLRDERLQLWRAWLGAGLGRLCDLKAVFISELDSRRLFLWLPVCMGIGVALFFAADGVPSAWPAAVCAGVCAAIAWRHRNRLYRPVVLTGVAFVFAGFAAAAFRTALVAAPALDRPAFATLTGFVEAVDAGPQGGRMVLRLTGFETSFAVTKPERLRVTFKGTGPRAGDHISGKARLMPPPQPAFPGGYDFARDAYYLGLGAVGRWSGPIKLSPQPFIAPLRLRIAAAIDNARSDLTTRIARTIGGQAGALSAALVTGKRGLLEDPVNEQLRASGLYHIVSISGLHMVLAAGVFFWLARAVLVLLPGVAERYPIKKIAAAIAMLGATAYCIFSGSEVATERSLIMTLVLLGAILFDRPALSMRNLALAAMLVLVREPETMVGPSFQMSFAAVAAMIAAHEWWSARQNGKREPAGWGGIVLRRLALAVAASLATTLIASFATAPFAAFHFQRVNPYGLIGNALAIPFVSLVVMPAAVAGTLLLPFGLDGGIWQLMGIGSQYVLEVARYVAGIEGAVRGVRAFDIGLLAWMATGFVILVLVRAPIRMVGIAVMTMATIAAARTAPADILIDRQGQVAAVRGAHGRLEIVGRAASRFVVDRWLAADGDLRKAQDQALRRNTACDRAGCVGQLADGRSIAVVLAPEAFEEDCRRAAIIVSSLSAPAFCQKTALVLDRERLAFSSSLAIHYEGTTFRVIETRSFQHWKPWYGRAESETAPANKTIPALPARDRAQETLQQETRQQETYQPEIRQPENLTPEERATDAADDGADILSP